MQQVFQTFFGENIPAKGKSGPGTQTVAVQVPQSISLQEDHESRLQSNKFTPVKAVHFIPLWIPLGGQPTSAGPWLCQTGLPTTAFRPPWQPPCPAPV